MRVLTPLFLLFACVLASSLVNGATIDKKVTNALKFILKSEGGCQNSASDSGNKMTIGGKSVVGYTCAGLTPGNAWTYRKEFGAKCAASCKAQDKFSKCCYDLDSKAYTDNVGNVYQKFFFKTGGCDTYADPTYTACADGTMNGIKTANTIKAWEKAHPYSKKSSEQAFCIDISEVIRCQSYEPAGNVEKNKKFMGGWRNRSFERECICKGLTRGSAACTAHVKARNAEVEKNTNCKKYGGKDELNKSASGKKPSSASKQSSNKKPASTGNKKPAANSKKPSNKKASGNKK